MNILVVEREPAVAQTIRELLLSHHYTIDIAPDGATGLAMAKATPYALVILDERLSRLKQGCLCEQLHQPDLAVPVLLMVEQEANVENFRVDDYVVKPLRQKLFITRVESLLRAAKLKATQQQLQATEADLQQRNQQLEALKGQPIPTQQLHQSAMQVMAGHQMQVMAGHQRARENELRAIFNSTVEFMGLLNPDGIVVDANHAALGVIGAKLADVIGQPFWTTPWWTHDPIQQQRLRQAIQRAAGGEFVQFETNHIKSDGTRMAVDFSLKPIFDEAGQVVRLVPEGRDITHRKRTEMALRESEAKFRLFAENSQVVIWMAAPDFPGRTIYVNPAYEAIWGRSCQELEDHPLSWLEAVHPEDRSAAKSFLSHLSQAGSGQVEYRIIRPNGDIRWVRAWGFAVLNEAGNTTQYNGFAMDITEQKQAEIALQRQIRQEYLLADFAEDIRQSLDLHTVLARTVHRVREFLDTDRVVVFRFAPDWQGEVIMESVREEWQSLISTNLFDPCFSERYVEPYRRGRVSVVADIHQGALEPCYVKFLDQFQVQANLVAPILQGENLWGLIIAHHCSQPRPWEADEIAMVRRLSTKVGIAIQQSELYERTRQELKARRRIQRVLEASEERFRTLSAAAPVGILQTDAAGNCLYVNGHWREISGLGLEESQGYLWQQAIHPDDRGKVTYAWENHLQRKGAREAEFRLLRPDGAIRWVAARAAAIKSGNGETIGNVCIYTDITEQKRAAEKIQEQASLLNIASDAIILRDLNHRITYWNRGAERIYGWSAAEVLGQRVDELLGLSRETYEGLMQPLMEQGEHQQEVCDRTRSGELITALVRWTVVRDEAGQPTAILSVATDITEKKSLEAQVYQAQRLESLGRLASGIAHDLNNVLTPILTLAQLLPLTQPGLNPQGHQQVKLLEDSAKRGASLVKQILTVTRGTPGEVAALDVVPLLQEVTDLICQSFPKNIDIQLNLPAPCDLGTVLADPTHIHQVMMNLCINARDAMAEGGVLTLAAANTYVDRDKAVMNLDAQEGAYVVITVADTGTGIPPEVCDRIFDPFFTTKKSGEGSGLGLSTVQGLTKTYGGFLEVATKVDQGTAMRVYLPVMAAAPEPPVSGSAAAQVQGQNQMILLVEDEPMVRDAIQALLEGHHYRTLTATDGIAAIDQYTQHQGEIDLVVSDVMMPNMDGIALIQNLRHIDPQVKVLALSGLATQEEHVLGAGAKGFLAKPYDLDTLLAKIGELVVMG